jgi:hypothetical protein
MNNLTVCCGYCAGSGRVKLAAVYSKTLELLKKHPGLNGAQLAKLAKCKPAAMANRLVAIEKHGLARSQRSGVEKKWTAI